MKSAGKILFRVTLAAAVMAVAPSARAQIQTTGHARFTECHDHD